MSVTGFNENYLFPLLYKITKENKKCFLMGNFNINLLDYDKKANVSVFQNLLSSHMFTPYILKPTSITEKSATLIDNMFFNSLKSPSYSGNITTKISDHLVQFLLLKNKNNKKESLNKHNLYHRDFKFFNHNEFKNNLQAVNWDKLYTLNDTNLAFDSFLSTITKLIDEHAPLKCLTKHEIQLKSKPWIAKNIQNFMIQRDKLYKLYCRKKNFRDKQIAHDNFKAVRNQVVHKIEISKKNYFERFFDNNVSNTKKI